ncbi:SDR family NAD(P)-dependent oxidoreductase [Methylobacterium bullatum]|uniref:3-oxoacyl-[acyl-carrier-protein] reductase FabG n=1 Tax=Methylobacterium bullatum TaxID=570505 RepID=A0AAV4Z9X4_9HYPH|nr:hypothetical protein [Methylobacterium bullatum]GJD40334.1 3-oxoacyl-[acyl-carrier-protein] reductase FabG [Methylobacterium bullatum]
MSVVERTSIIIGASGLVGSAVARRLIRGGRNVILTSTTEFTSRRAELGDLSNQIWHAVDVRDESQVSSLFTDPGTGSGRFDVVYCAGMICDKPIAKLAYDDWKRVISVNLDGAFLTVRAAFQNMAVRGEGSIVLVSSISARRAQAGQAAYAASKAALEALCRCAAVELGRFNVTCNVVAPGPLSGGMMEHVRPAVKDALVQRTPLRRLGSAEDAAAAVEFLLGPGARHITGQTILVDGGFTVT